MANATPFFPSTPFGSGTPLPTNEPPPSINSILGPGSIGGNAAPDYNDLFAGLLELQWREIGFPFTRFRTVVRQDLAIHKFADRDGAHVEGTGRAPLEFTARVPLLNGLDAGKNEHWSRPLYPFVRDNLLRACADRSSGILQHPELGNFTCKVVTMEWELEAQVRSGVWVDFKWIETDDTGVDLQTDLANPSPLANAQAAANDLDFNISQFNPIVTPDPFVPPISFSDLVNSVRAVVDQTTALSKSTAGRLDNIVYEANALRDSLNRAQNASPLNWPLLNGCERAKESSYDLKSSLIQKGRPVKFFTTQKDSTLAQISAAIGTNVMDLISLNPAYAQTALVPKGSIVRFYATS